MMSSSKQNKRTYVILFAIFAALLLIVELFNFRHSGSTLEYRLVYGIFARLFGAAICIVLMSYCSYSYLFSFKGIDTKGILLILPCVLIAVNNFPFVPVLSSGVEFSAKWYLVLLYAVECFLVGLFEETAFRGCVFMLVLEKRHKTKKDIFFSIIFSSLIFGAIHIVNLFAGSGIVPVILQLGYSFLIGSMCAVILLVTKNIWFSVVIHALFNFAGGVMPTFVSNFKIWTVGEIILTVVVSLIVAAYVIIMFFKYDLKKLQKILNK